MKLRTLAALLAMLLLPSSASIANHPQGCNTLGAAVVAPVGPCPKNQPDDQPQNLSGCAYGAFSKVTVLPTGTTAVLNNVAPINFKTALGANAWPALTAPCPLADPTFPQITNFVASVSNPAPVVLSATTVGTRTQGRSAVWGATSHALSAAETQNLSLSVPALGLSIKANVVRSVAYCTKLAGPKGRNDVGPGGVFAPAALANLTVTTSWPLPASVISVPVLPAEDTWIPILGVGGIMLRETWDLEAPPWPANSYKSFTENMIHVYFFGNPVVAGDVVISHAHCDGRGLIGKPPFIT